MPAPTAASPLERPSATSPEAPIVAIVTCAESQFSGTGEISGSGGGAAGGAAAGGAAAGGAAAGGAAGELQAAKVTSTKAVIAENTRLRSVAAIGSRCL